MRPQLILQPIHNSSADILKSFALGRPLNCEQIHFLNWHQKELSNMLIDPLLKYYLKLKADHRPSSFLLPCEEINTHSIASLKKRLQATLQSGHHQAVIQLTYKQFLEFKEYSFPELIFWHGNQFLTGAPFYPSCVPPVIFFQWGNYFGIVKYVALPGEKSLKANVLIYFEDMQDRHINECVENYNQQLKNDIAMQNKHLQIEENINHVVMTPHFKTPKLTLSNYSLIDSVSK